jgi:hypothetical protein
MQAESPVVFTVSTYVIFPPLFNNANQIFDPEFGDWTVFYQDTDRRVIEVDLKDTSITVTTQGKHVINVQKIGNQNITAVSKVPQKLEVRTLQGKIIQVKIGR